MSNVPENIKIDIESIKQEIREEFQEDIKNYVSDMFDIVNENIGSGFSRSDSPDDPDPGEDPDPEPGDPIDFQLSLKFKNNRGRYVSPINIETGETRSFGVVSEPDGQGNVSVKVFARIEEELNKKPAYYTITYQLVD